MDELTVKLAEENKQLKETLQAIKDKLTTVKLITAVWADREKPLIKMYDMNGMAVGDNAEVIKDEEIFGEREIVTSMELNIKKLLRL